MSSKNEGSDPRPRAEPPNRRASPDVVEKRRAARFFNDAISGKAQRAPDGRTERRRKRLLKELEERAARNGKRELKPIDVLARVQELLDLGEALAVIRKASPPPRALAQSPELIDGVRRIHRAYAFAVEVYQFVGIDAEVLRAAGVLDAAKKPGLARGTREKPPRAGVA